MQHVDTVVVSAEMRASARRLVDRLGVVRVQNAPRWQPIVDQLDLGSMAAQPVTGKPIPTVVVVGSPADVLDHGRHATNGFGFVMPVAQIAQRRARSWRDDATLDLWHDGWSPLNIDRLLVSTRDATIEFVIGDVCPIPEVQVPVD